MRPRAPEKKMFQQNFQRRRPDRFGADGRRLHARPERVVNLQRVRMIEDNHDTQDQTDVPDLLIQIRARAMVFAGCERNSSRKRARRCRRTSFMPPIGIRGISSLHDHPNTINVHPRETDRTAPHAAATGNPWCHTTKRQRTGGPGIPPYRSVETVESVRNICTEGSSREVQKPCK